ncbi:MAG: GNAT family N-acetyltransferase [Anaerolineae bacterium]|nr:GNAT family N-acetyltransferase [Anaerolineae bacterium]
MGDIEVRPVTTIEAMQQVEAVQRAIWSNDEHMVIHTHWMVALAHNGGLVLGAYDGDRMVGFLVGFLGLEQPIDSDLPGGKLKHVSKRMGVLPAYQNAGVGLKLKLAQRDLVRRQGVSLITWTFDPLRSRNAHFNLRKLGAVTHQYIRDYYGELHDLQNGGAPTDRVIAEWWISTERVRQRLSGGRPGLTLQHFISAGAPLLNPTESGRDGLTRPGEKVMPVACTDRLVVLVEIPNDFGAILERDHGLASAWRTHARAVFEPTFAAGYIATDFVHEVVAGRPRSFYALSLMGV